MFFLVLLPLVVRSFGGQLDGEEVGLLVRHFLPTYFLYASVGSVIFFANVPGDLRV